MAAIDLPAGKLLVQNIVLLFLPMAAGALFRRWRPDAARRVHASLGRVAFPALMLLAAVFFVQYAGTILENLGTLGLAAGALILLAMSAGSLLSRVFGLRRAARENRRHRGRDAERRAGHRHRRLAADPSTAGRWPSRPSSTPC